jgi:hypothetical protein
MFCARYLFQSTAQQRIADGHFLIHWRLSQLTGCANCSPKCLTQRGRVRCTDSSVGGDISRSATLNSSLGEFVPLKAPWRWLAQRFTFAARADHPPEEKKTRSSSRGSARVGWSSILPQLTLSGLRFSSRKQRVETRRITCRCSRPAEVSPAPGRARSCRLSGSAGIP